MIQKFIKKVSRKNLRLSIVGKTLFFFVLGAIFSLHVIPYNTFVVPIAGLFLLYYASTVTPAVWKKEKIEFGTHIFGIIGLYGIGWFLGTQFSALPLKGVFLVGTIIMTLPAVNEVLFKK